MISEKVLSEISKSKSLQTRMTHLAFTLKIELKYWDDADFLTAMQYIVDRINAEKFKDVKK
jgi:hypothetical protein